MKFPTTQLSQFRKINYINKQRRLNTMKKNYVYKNISYTITIELNAKAEKHINGKQWDKLTISCKDIFHKEQYAERDSLLGVIAILILECNSKIDNLENEKTEFEKILADMGFE